MAYIIKSLKRINLKNRNKADTVAHVSEENKIFIFIVILTAIVISVDYALIIKFINIIKNI